MTVYRHAAAGHRLFVARSGPDAGTRFQVVEDLVPEPADRPASDPDRRREEPTFA